MTNRLSQNRFFNGADENAHRALCAVIIFIGIFASIGAYIALSSQSYEIIHADISQDGSDIVSEIYGNIEGTAHDLRMVAALAENIKDADDLRAALIKKPQAYKFFSQILLFDTDAQKSLVVLYRAQGGSAQTRPQPAVKNAAALSSLIHAIPLPADNNMRIFDNPMLFQSGDNSAPMMIVMNAGGSRFVMAVVDVRVLMESVLHNPEHGNLVRLKFTSAEGAGVTLELWRDPDFILHGHTLERAFEINLGHKAFEIRLAHVTNNASHFIRYLPFMSLAAGFLITLMAALMLRGAYYNAAHLRDVRDVLSQKTRALELETLRNERLSKKLQRTENESRSLIDSVSDVVFETDTRARIVFLNATWEKVTGMDRSKAQGLDLVNMLHIKDQEATRAAFNALVDAKTPLERWPVRMRTEDGNFRAIEISAVLLQEDQTNRARIAGTITDVEERRRSAHALEEAEKKYRAIVENAAGGIFQLSPEGVYLSANPALARILGYESAPALMASVTNVFDKVYMGRREREVFLKSVEDSGQVENTEIQVFMQDGSRIWVSENIRAVKNDLGQILYFEGSLEDITRRKQTEAALREAKVYSDLANRAKSDFLANMSHELRTPLNSIIGFSEIILNEIFGPLGQPQYKEYARDIHESGKRLLSVISEILDISKIDAGERHLNEQIVDVEALSLSCLRLLEGKIRSSGVVVSNNLTNIPKLVAEELAIKQILVNIISNAVKFTPAGGRVMIGGETDKDGHLRITITDTGIGLDAGEIEKALSPFGQINNALSRAKGGAGLGLTLAKALIALHDGSLEMFSQKGIGTSVTIVFPADRVQKPRPIAGAASLPSSSSSTNL